MIAGLGDVVLRIDKERNLENAFGKADVFGRKTKAGFTELRFAGLEQSGIMVFYRKDVQVVTNETTMSRTPISTTTGSANTNVNASYYNYGNFGTAHATANTNYSSTTVAPEEDYHVVVPQDAIPIRLPAGENKIPMEGHVIEILDVTSTMVEYTVSKY